MKIVLEREWGNVTTRITYSKPAGEKLTEFVPEDIKGIAKSLGMTTFNLELAILRAIADSGHMAGDVKITIE